MTAADFAALVDGKRNGSRWHARCPSHEDKNASLSISEGADGRVLVKCHAGCRFEDIVGAAGVKPGEMFPPKSDAPKKTIVETYPYQDESGALLYEVVRFTPKDFRQRQPDGKGGWQWNMQGVRRVLYRLPEVLVAVDQGQTVLVVEGEKDAAALVGIGYCATCNVGGAGKWSRDYTNTLTGADVVAIPDRDAPGRAHVAAVGAALAGVVQRYRVLELPTGKDSHDWIASGGTAAQLQELIDTAPEWTEVVEPEVLPGNEESLSKPDEFTELEFANRLAAELPPIKTVGDDWFAYSTGSWRSVTRSQYRPTAQRVLPPLLRTARRESTLLEHIEGRCQIPPDSFRGFYAFDPAGRILLNVSNGVLAVEPGGAVELLPHDPSHLFSRQTVAAFDPEQTAPTFVKVLLQALPDEEDRDLFSLFAGSLLLPDSRYEAALVAYGEAGRSKSTLAEPIANALGTDLVSRLSLSQLCDPKGYHVPKLKFAAVNLGTELDAVEINESGAFKTVISGEPVEARPIYGEPFTMTTTTKLLFLSNQLPRFKHGTEAELRRTRFIRFDQKPATVDVTLRRRLAGETNGVFLWMLDGLSRLLQLPAMPLGSSHSVKVHERFKVSNDPIGTFVDQCCELSADAWSTKETLASAFDEYCTTHEIPPGMKDWFFKHLKDRFPNLVDARPQQNGTRVRVVQGIRVKSGV